MAEPTKNMKRFAEWLTDHARGTLNDEITLAMGEVVEAVTHLEKKGKVVIEIEVSPAGAGRRRVVVAGTVTAKPPIPAPEQSIFFTGDNGSLHRDDPYQERMEVPDPAETGPDNEQEPKF